MEKNETKGSKREQKNVEEEVLASYLEKAPDGGWGWAVVFGGGIAFSLLSGYNSSVSLFYEELLRKFRQSASATAWVISISTTIAMVLSPLGSAFCSRFSHRTMGMTCGFLMASAYLTAAFVPTLYFLYFTYAVLHGLGMALFQISFFSMVNMYFTKNRGKANSISSCFKGIGALYMAPLLAFLFLEYGYSGALIILAALSLHPIPAAALFRPLKLTSKVSNTHENIQIQDKDPETASKPDIVVSSSEGDPNTQTTLKDIVSDDYEYTIREEGEIANVSRTEDKTPKSTKKRVDKRNIYMVARITYAFRGCSSLLHLGGLKNRNFAVLCFLMASYSMLNECIMTLVAGLALEKHFHTSEVTLMMSINAAVEIPFRCLSGVVFDLKSVTNRRPLALGIIGGLPGILANVQPFLPGVILFIVNWSLMQGFLAAFHTQYITVMSDLVERQEITSSFGILRLIQGLGCLIGPLLGGVIHDLSGSYQCAFVVAGSQFVLMCLIFILTTRLRLPVDTKPHHTAI